MSNPFKIAEKVLSTIGWVILFGLGACGVALLIVAAIMEWGWWSLLLIPGVPIALAALVLTGALLRWATDTIQSRWRMAKWRWDDRNRHD